MMKKRKANEKYWGFYSEDCTAKVHSGKALNTELRRKSGFIYLFIYSTK